MSNKNARTKYSSKDYASAKAAEKLLDATISKRMEISKLAIEMQLRGFNISRNLMYRIVQGKRRITGPEAEAFSEILGIPIEEFFED